MAPPPIVLPAQRRTTLLLNHGVAAITLPWVGFVAGQAVGVAHLDLLGFAAMLAAIGLSLARRWGDRVEFSADHLVEWRAGRPRRLAYDDVAEVDLRWSSGGRNLNTDATATFRDAGGARVAVDSTYRELRGAVELVSEAVASRMVARIRGGETLTFVDRPSFPAGAVLLFGFFLLPALLMVLRLATGDRPGIMGMFWVSVMLLSSGWRAIRALGTWNDARRSRGVAVSAQGVAPLASYAPPQAKEAGYRSSPYAANDWIPWGAIESVREDGFSVTLLAAGGGDPVVLSPATRNLIVLSQLLRREAKQAPTSGVRVAPDDAEGVPDEEDERDDEPLSVRRR